jgi:hypothetical protein
MKKHLAPRKRYLLIHVALVALLSLFAMPSLYADDAAATTQSQTESKSSRMWDGLLDSMKTVTNPFSEVSVRDAGVKPRIRPHLHGGSGWNSNANVGEKDSGTNSKAGWQARISPGVTLEVPVSEKMYTMLDYTYSFSTTQGPDISENENTHNLGALVRYDYSKDTSLGVNNNFQISDMPNQAGKRFLLETVKPEIQHTFGEKLRSALNYQFQHYRDVGPTDDSDSSTITRDTFNDNSVTGSLTYDVACKLSLTPQFSWHVREYPKTDEKSYWSISPDLGAVYGLGSKTKLTGHFGWGYRRFKDEGNASELLYGAGINHMLGRKFTWAFNYDKTQQDTFDTGFINRDTPIATNLDNYDRHFRTLNVHRFGTTTSYFLNEKNLFSLFGDFSFVQTKESDNIVSSDENDEKKMEIGGMYSYKLTRFLDLRLGYTFGRSFYAGSTSNTARTQYTYHKVDAGVNLNF